MHLVFISLESYKLFISSITSWIVKTDCVNFSLLAMSQLVLGLVFFFFYALITQVSKPHGGPD